MKFFLDTANLDEIRKGVALGVVDGVTTNPTLVAKEGRDFHDTILEIAGLVDGPVNAEVTTLTKDEMLRDGREYAKWHKNIIVKLPTTREGVAACKILSGEGIKTNMTLCFSAAQALLVAKAGAWCVSPFVGRIDDGAWDGVDLVRQIVYIYSNYEFETQVLAASLRHPLHVVQCAEAGADIGTMPFKVLDSLYNHPLTDKGLAQFLDDWNKAKAQLEKSSKKTATKK
jgi:transaldolase